MKGFVTPAMDGKGEALEALARQLRSVCAFTTTKTAKSSRYVEVVPRGLGIIVEGDGVVRGCNGLSCLRRQRMISAVGSARNGSMFFRSVRSLLLATGILLCLINQWEMMNH